MEANNTSLPGWPSLSTPNTTQSTPRLLPPPTFVTGGPAAASTAPDDQELPIAFLEGHGKSLLQTLEGLSREDRSRAVMEPELQPVTEMLAERRGAQAGMFGGWGAAGPSGTNGDVGRKRGRENSVAGAQGRPKIVRRGIWDSPLREGTGTGLGLQENGGESNEDYDGDIDWDLLLENNANVAGMNGAG